LAAISIGQREFEQWNLDVSALRCVRSGSKSRHFKRQASQEFWTPNGAHLLPHEHGRLYLFDRDDHPRCAGRGGTRPDLVEHDHVRNGENDDG